MAVKGVRISEERWEKRKEEEEEEKQETLKALESAAGFVRRELAEKLRLRHIPDLTFEWDSSIERGAHLLDLLDKVAEESAEKEKKKTE